MKQSELTIRGLILGAIIAVVFTAANVYMGLVVAITVASSIPAAVISMGVLRFFKTGTIRENNIVQTVASSGGTLSAIIFVLPGLVMVGYWRGFDYLTTFLICALGGILGVLFSIPLRRALVVNTPLPFPEGVAAAEVLKVGATGDEASPDAIERNRGPLVVAFGAMMAAILKILSFVGLSAESLTKYFRVGVAGATGVDIGITLALAGAGHIVGISVGMAMLLGLLITWAGFVPLWTQGFTGDMGDAVIATWKNVRLVGAGAIGTAAIWSLVKLVGPLIGGVKATMEARKTATAPTGAADDRDIPMTAIVGISVLCLAAIAWLIWSFIGAGPLSPLALTLTIGGVIFAVVVGFFIAAVAGYMAGLIGASNSPVSGIGILATVAAAALLVVFAQPVLGPSATNALVAFTLFLVSVVFSVATISNDNLQDLKTGFLVGASPWKQQVALIVGVLAGAAIIPPVLDLLNHSNGFPGDPNRHAIAHELQAPQAVLISTLAKGVLNAQLDWGLIRIGIGLGVALIVLDEILGLMKLLRLPPLAVGLGIYLPMSATQPVIVGAIIGYFYNKAMDKRPNAEMAKRFGVLLASGLIVGESLFGILQAGLIVATNNPQPFALVGKDFADFAPFVGLVLFALALIISYAWTSRQSKA